jgi:hypothetical protein
MLCDAEELEFDNIRLLREGEREDEHGRAWALAHPPFQRRD